MCDILPTSEATILLLAGRIWIRNVMKGKCIRLTMKRKKITIFAMKKNNKYTLFFGAPMKKCLEIATATEQYLQLVCPFFLNQTFF